MTSPIIYETFDQWFQSLKSEPDSGEYEWLKAAFEAGRAGAFSQAAMVCMEEAQKSAGDYLVPETLTELASDFRALGDVE